MFVKNCFLFLLLFLTLKNIKRYKWFWHRYYNNYYYITIKYKHLCVFMFLLQHIIVWRIWLITTGDRTHIFISKLMACANVLTLLTSPRHMVTRPITYIYIIDTSRLEFQLLKILILILRFHRSLKCLIRQPKIHKHVLHTYFNI